MKKQNAKTVQTQIVAALAHRVASADNANAAKNYLVEQKKFEADSMKHCIQVMIENGYDFSSFSARLMNNDKSAVESNDYVAIYALQKVRKALQAIGQNIVSEFDGYTQAIVANLVRLQTVSTLDAQRAISRKIELDEFAQQTVIKHRMNCQPSTASTQASSTREMLRILDICIVHKKHKNDAISFADTKQAETVKQLFANFAA